MPAEDRISNFHVIAVAGSLIAQEIKHKKNNQSDLYVQGKRSITGEGR